MTQVGEKYFFVSLSAQEGGDLFRTLLGGFWTWHSGLVIASKIVDPERQNKLTSRLSTYYMVEGLKERKEMEGKNAAAREKIYMGEKASADTYLRMKTETAYVLPKGVLQHMKPLSSQMKKNQWILKTENDGTRLETMLILYGKGFYSYPDDWKAFVGAEDTSSRSSATHSKGAGVEVVRPIVNNVVKSIIQYPVWYADFAFEVERPLHQSVTDKMNPGAAFIRRATIKKNCHYSYFLENYEIIASGFGVEELDLPNIYVVNMHQYLRGRFAGKPSKAKSVLDPQLTDIVTLGKRIDFESVSFRVGRNSTEAIKEPRKIGQGKKRRRNPNSTYMEYLELFSESYNNLSGDEIEDIRRKNKNIIFATDSYDQFNQVTSNRANVPFGVRLRFSIPSIPKEDSLVELFSKANFMSILMQKATEAHEDPDQITPMALDLWDSSTMGVWLNPEAAAAAKDVKTHEGAPYADLTNPEVDLLTALGVESEDAAAIADPASDGFDLMDVQKQIAADLAAADADAAEGAEPSSAVKKAIEQALDAMNVSEKEIMLNLDRDWAPIDYFGQTYSLDPSGNINVNSDKSTSSVRSQAFDIMRFLERITSAGPVTAVDPIIYQRNIVIHGGNEINLTYFLATDNSGDPVKSITTKAMMASFILTGQIMKLMSENMRSWKQIVAGKPSVSEILFFEVEKVKIPERTGEPTVIQRFYIPNFVGRDSIELLDTQVKHDGVYRYIVNAWVAVYGNSYRYNLFEELPWDIRTDTGLQTVMKQALEAMDSNDPADDGFDLMEVQKQINKDLEDIATGDFDGVPTGASANETNIGGSDGFLYGVTNKPQLWLKRVPYYTCDPIRVRDFPPVPPQVDFVPYRGVSDRVIINFTRGVDDYQTTPIALRSTDYSVISKYYQSQYDQSVGDAMSASPHEVGLPVRYKSDDIPRFYEVFRVDVAPQSWGDFDGSRIQALDVNENQSSMIDYIRPNVDYYYTFRCVDVHGSVSNPSNVLRVKMVDDQGVFPIIEPYDFEEKRTPRTGYQKPLRRFLQITPVFEQLVYKDERQENQKQSAAEKVNVNLGVAEKSIYGKTLKFRLTSKKSGKVVDINVSFSHEHKKPLILGDLV